MTLDYVQSFQQVGFDALAHQFAITTPTSVPLPLPLGGWALVLETTGQGGFSWTQGDSDGTELTYSGDARYTWGIGAGARLLTPWPVSLGYQHMWLSIESDMRLGHWFVHQLVVTGLTVPVLIPLAILEEKASNPFPFKLATMAALWGAQFAFYTLVDYDQHNWPFDDPPPMRVSQHVVSLGARF